jgi:Arc/MetJ-type ribon-helix-helix transcriptional regulator
MPDHEMDEHIGCVLPRSERIALDAWAKRNDLSRSQAIRRAIRRLLAQANAPSRYQTRDDNVRRAAAVQNDGDSHNDSVEERDDAGEVPRTARPHDISSLPVTQ